MAISVEHGVHKTVFVIFSIVLVFLAAYPFLIRWLPQINLFNENFTPILIIIVAILQLIYTIRSFKKSAIYRSF